MGVCIVWERVRRGFVIIGLFNILVFAGLILLYFIIANMLIANLNGIKLIVALTTSGLGVAFIATYVFHVAIDAFRRIKRLDKETRRGLEICV